MTPVQETVSDLIRYNLCGTTAPSALGNSPMFRPRPLCVSVAASLDGEFSRRVCATTGSAMRANGVILAHELKRYVVLFESTA